MAARKKPELLIPASSLDVLKTAVTYGADAVYCGTSSLSLRTRADMKDDDLIKTIELHITPINGTNIIND